MNDLIPRLDISRLIVRDLNGEIKESEKQELKEWINELKQMAIVKINELKEQHETDDDLSVDLDLTRSAYPIALGTRHPLTIVRNQIIDIFQRMGFTLAKVLRLTMTCMCLQSSTLLQTIPHATCRTPSS